MFYFIFRDSFYEQIPISLLHHTNGNGIYNTSHPLLERLVGQLEVEAPCPYNSIPYDYRMSQMWVEGTLGIVPKLAPKIMLNEEGQNITLSDNRAMFNKWANRWEAEEPYKFTKAIHNYAATNLIPRHLGPEYVIHGAKLYSPWDPSKIEVTLVVSEWFFDRSLNLIKSLDTKDHPFNHVIIMIPPSVSNDHDYSKYTKVPVTLQFRDSPDFMDLCSAEVSTKWFMITNAYHLVSGHVDLMFTPGKSNPVIPFTPATYPFCLKYPYCNEIVKLAQRWNPSHKQVVLDMDMLYSTKERDEFCEEWVERNGDQGEHLYAKYQPMRYKRRGDKIIGPKGPTGTDYLAYLASKKKDGMYKMTDRSLYGARDSFVKVYRKEEKLDGMSEEELARRLGFTLMSNTTECSCDRFESEEECVGSGIGCVWRALFESCHPPEMIDDGVPICETTDAPTMSPTVSIDSFLREIESPTVESATSASGESINDAVKDATVDAQSIIETLFKSREHELDSEANVTEDVLLTNDDDAIVTVDFVDHSIKENTLLGDRNLSEEESSSSRNRLLFSSTDTSENRASEELLENNEIGQVLPLNDDVLSNFDSISLYAIMKTPGVSKMNWLSRAKNIANEDTREMSCPTWGPSIVPRIISDVSQSSVEFSSSLFLNLKNRLSGSDSVAPLIKSRLTESVFHIRARHTRHQLLEIDSNNRLAERTVGIPPSHEIKNRRIHVKYSDELEQLRIKFVTSSISKDKNHSTNARVTTYIEQVLPPVATVWGETLQIFRPLESLFPRGSTCGETPIPEDHLKEGVADADIVIYVDFMEPSSCTTDSKPQLSICHFDQNMRPLFGSLSVCLADIDVQDRKVNEKEVLRHIVMLTQLVGGFLGLSPNLFKYFRNPETGQLWGERTVQLSCGNGDGVEMEVLLSNIIEQRAGVDVEAHYEIVTPTVRQVVRNHFDCQELTGARLSAPLPDPNNHGECTFFNLDLRFHFDEDMTPISQNAGAAFAVSPLSLALLEDSSWYLADFSGATTPTFGRGAGCGFLEDLCISDGKVPDYSAGFYCSTSDETPGSPTGCDYTHRNKAGCDLIANANPPTNFQYYGSNHREFGSPYEDVRYCPMRSKHLVSCSFQSMDSNMESLPGEFFDENSRCYETDVGSPVCLETTCNSADKTLDVIINGGTFRCSYNGQVINVELGYSIVCPRIAVVCPDLICPSNCSGKGVCDYCKYVPKCICDDQFDETPGCWAL